MSPNTGVVYRIDERPSAAEVAELYGKSGLRRPYRDIGRVERMVQEADVTISARSDDALVGFLRALTDRVWCCYVSCLCVDPPFQRLGVGRALLERLQHELGDGITIHLLANAKSASFYERVGFEHFDLAYGVRRRR